MPPKWVQEVRDSITDTIVKALKAGNLPPWRKPWHDGGLMPRNGHSKRPYGGINVLHLQAVAYLEQYLSNDWFTYNGIQQLGGSVRTGEGPKSTILIYYKLVKKNKNDPDSEVYPLMRYYRVWNRDQTENIPAAPLVPELSEEERISGAEDVVTSLKKHDGLKIDPGSKACYCPSTDIIEMPPYSTFKAAELYYATLYHEIVHWTGSKRKLNRDQAAFGTQRNLYAYEELVAELGSAFLCSHTKIVGETQPAEYIKSWIKLIEDDSKAIFTASTLAQRAVDYIITKSGVKFWDAPDEEAA